MLLSGDHSPAKSSSKHITATADHSPRKGPLVYSQDDDSRRLNVKTWLKWKLDSVCSHLYIPFVVTLWWHISYIVRWHILYIVWRHILYDDIYTVWQRMMTLIGQCRISSSFFRNLLHSYGTCNISLRSKCNYGWYFKRNQFELIKCRRDVWRKL